MSQFVYQKTCSRIFIIALFIIGKNRNNSNVYQEVNGETNCDMSIQWDSIEQLKNKLLIHTTTYMNHILLNGRPKSIYMLCIQCITLFIPS